MLPSNSDRLPNEHERELWSHLSDLTQLLEQVRSGQCSPQECIRKVKAYQIQQKKLFDKHSDGRIRMIHEKIIARVQRLEERKHSAKSNTHSPR
jgi:hypothetical protein